MAATQVIIPPGRQLADVGKRFIAALIDFAISLAGIVVVVILGAIADPLAVLGYLALLAFWIYNSVYLQGTTGQTIGKKQQGIYVLNQTTGQPVGMGMAFVRMLLQGIIGHPCLLLVDHWWILVRNSTDRQRLSDKILGFNVFADGSGFRPQL